MCSGSGPRRERFAGTHREVVFSKYMQAQFCIERAADRTDSPGASPDKSNNLRAADGGGDWLGSLYWAFLPLPGKPE